MNEPEENKEEEKKEQAPTLGVNVSENLELVDEINES